jgi:hypothetical protein
MGREKSKKQDLRHPETQHKEKYEDTYIVATVYYIGIVATVYYIGVLIHAYSSARCGDMQHLPPLGHTAQRSSSGCTPSPSLLLCMYAYTYVHIYTYVYTYVHTYRYTYACVCVYIVLQALQGISCNRRCNSCNIASKDHMLLGPPSVNAVLIDLIEP